MKLDTFYTFYSKDLGVFSQYLFGIFWQGRYEECVKLYEIPLKLFSNNISSLGMNDALIYHHCAYLSGRDVLDLLQVPPPPSRSQIINLYDYEVSEEKHIPTSLHTNSILTQPSVLHKAILAARVGVLTECEEAIETGTNLGMSSYLFSGPFDIVDTIEADRNLYLTSSRWLSAKSKKKINCLHGNSAYHLETILSHKSKKQLIFLDAHYSSGITSNEFGECPLLDELAIIFKSGINCTIVVDDIRLMGSAGWPDLKSILSSIPNGKQVVIEHDQMIIS